MTPIQDCIQLLRVSIGRISNSSVGRTVKLVSAFGTVLAAGCTGFVPPPAIVGHVNVPFIKQEPDLCIYACVEMWETYLKFQGKFLHPIVTQSVLARDNSDVSPAGIKRWLPIYITEADGFADDHGAINEAIYRKINPAPYPGNPDIPQPSIVAVNGVDHLAPDPPPFNHAIVVTGMYYVNGFLTTTFAQDPDDDFGPDNSTPWYTDTITSEQWAVWATEPLEGRASQSIAYIDKSNVSLRFYIPETRTEVK